MIWSLGKSGESFADQYSRYAMFLTALIAVILLPVLFSLFRQDTLENPECRKDNSIRVPFRFYLIGILGSAGTCLLVSTALSISGLPDADPLFNEVNDMITSSGFLVQTAAACIVVPAAEELLFRGLIFRRVKFSYGAGAGIVISAVLFGIYHGNWTQGIYAGLLGLLLAWAYQQTGAILVPILMHAFSNFTSLLIGETAAGRELESTTAGTLGLLTISFLFSVLCIFVFRKIKIGSEKEKQERKTEHETAQHRNTVL